MRRLLVIDDEIERTEQISDWFGSIDYEVVRAHSGLEGLQKARETPPDIVLLDIVMPEMDGHEVLLRLKRDPKTSSIPVVICSFTANELDGLKALMRTGLREGADYVVARKWGLLALEDVVDKVLSPHESTRVIRVGPHELRLGMGCAEVWVDGERRRLTPRESRILRYLDSERGRVCHVEKILEEVYRDTGDTSSVYKVIYLIQNKIEPDPKNPVFVRNIRGFGYKLCAGE